MPVLWVRPRMHTSLESEVQVWGNICSSINSRPEGQVCALSLIFESNILTNQLMPALTADLESPGGEGIE